MHKKLVGMAITIVLAILTMVSSVVKTQVQSDKNIRYKNTDIVGYMDLKARVRYTFTPTENINGIKVLVGTYGKKITKGRLMIIINDTKSGERLAKSSIPAIELHDNSFVAGYFDEIQTKDREITVEFRMVNMNESESITIWMGENSLDKEGITTFNKKNLSDDIIMTTCYREEKTPYSWELLLMTWIALMVTILIPRRESEDTKGGTT